MKRVRASVSRLIALASISLLLSGPAIATCGGGGGGGLGGAERIYEVPWKRIFTNEVPAKEGLILYWIPAQPQDYLRSPLRESRTLSLLASRCITLAVLDAGSPLATQVAGGDKLPLVVLSKPDGTVVNKVQSNGGAIKIADVESLMTTEMKKLLDSMKALMESGKNKQQSGDKDGAISDFRSIYDSRCLFPRLGKEAARRLRLLGAEGIEEVKLKPDLFRLKDNSRIVSIMLEGLQAEEASDFTKAERYYEAAHRMDPADPVPLRFLGELYRHHIGDWDEASEIFDEVIHMQADPLSKAVAYHGLGKMTIHEGDFKEGLALMEKSAQIYPLPITYRNLAVYWNSEGDHAKAAEYTKKALELAPQDPFNLIFSAVFLAAAGQKEEALKIARDNENILPASYNLAAIYAQSGQKEKALELLRRHFFQYERNDSVRSKEMMEARVDAVFASINKDPEFIALTKDADGKLQMPVK